MMTSNLANNEIAQHALQLRREAQRATESYRRSEGGNTSLVPRPPRPAFVACSTFCCLQYETLFVLQATEAGRGGLGTRLGNSAVEGIVPFPGPPNGRGSGVGLKMGAGSGTQGLGVGLKIWEWDSR